MFKVTLLFVSVLAVSCGANSLDLGQSDSNAGGTGSTEAAGGATRVGCPDAATGPTLPQWLAPEACVTGNENSAIVGEWEGYYQGSSIGDEGSTFRLKILGASTTSGVCGTFTFGANSPVVAMPVATDPTVVPPGVPASFGGMYPWYNSMLGAPYTLIKGAVDGQRVTFQLSFAEVYKSWCELQTSYVANEDCTYFQCLPIPANGVSSAKISSDSTEGSPHFLAWAQEFLGS